MSTSFADIAAVVVGSDTPAGHQIELGLTDRGVRMVGEHESVDLVVWARMDSGAGAQRDLADTSEETWVQRAEQPLHEMLTFFQDAHRQLRDRGGRIVVVVPTIAMTGAAGHTAWSTAAEGQRSFVKVAARMWGPEAITVNCVAVDAGLSDEQLRTEVAGVIASLATPEWATVTGQTIAVDGGHWMSP